MPKMTITEALAETKTIAKRIQKKKTFILQYVVRPSMMVDPLKEGSTAEISKERQAIRDLEQRLVNIRLGIARANLETMVEIHGKTKCVQEWLVWRREVAPGQVRDLEKITNQIGVMRRKAEQNYQTQVGERPTEDLVHTAVDERALAEEAEQLENILGTLDGKLSLINATTTIEV